MDWLDDLSEEDIADWVGEDSFARGREYLAEGRVLLPEREGGLLRARVRGSLPTPYDAEVYVGDEGIEGGYCTCPVGGRGRCKHVAALLLTWLAQPDAFGGPEDLATDLLGRGHDELVAIILRMIDRYPDLRTLIDLAGDSPDLETVRRAAVQAFLRGGYDAWRAADTIAEDLGPLLEVGVRHEAAGDSSAAVGVYSMLAEEIMAQYADVADDYQLLAAVFSECLAGLGRALAGLHSPAARAPILERLFGALAWAVDLPHPPIAEEVHDILLGEAANDERRLLAGWAWEALPAGASPLDRAARRALGRLMLDLEGDTLTDEAYLSLCRETGLWPEAVARLLDRGRLDEALEVLSEAHLDDVLILADLLADAGHAREAEAAVLERAEEGDPRLLEWLRERARAKGGTRAALEFAERLFWWHPSVDRYRELRDIALDAEAWDALRPTILGRLEERGEWRVLMRAALADGDIDASLGYAARAPVPPEPENHDVRIEVARAAEGERPRDAIRLWLEYVDALVRARGRPNYARAARVLRRIRRLHTRLGEQAVWRTLIADLRSTHRRLGALQDELSKARL